MALLCPNVNDPKWKELVDRVGEIPAYRAFYRFAHLPDPVQAALDRMDINRYSVENKITDLKAVSDKIRKIEGVDPETGEPIHEYRATNGKVLDSVSRILDRTEATAYRGGQEVGSQYSDKGTAIHKVFEMYIKGYSQDNIKQYLADQKIPEAFLSKVINIVGGLQKVGKVLSETMLGDLEVGIAGTGDIPVLLYSGGIELYDVKTAHLTPSGARMGKTKIWNPIEDFGGYKARRYPAQLEFYSRLIERTTGQPVNRKYIIPIEIKYINNDVTQGYEDIKVLPAEDTRAYGNEELANKIVTDFFGDFKPNSNLPSLTTVDDSDDLMRAITGRIEGRETDLDAESELILTDKRYHTKIRGELYYINKISNSPVRLRDQANRAMQKRQIIDEYLSKLNVGRENIDESIRNYLATGKDAFLDSGNLQAQYIKAMLDMYKGRRDVSVNKLSDIKGFDSKHNWILINDGGEKGGTNDLLYIGNDVLDETLNVGRKTKSGDTLFAKFMSKRDAEMLLSSDLKNRVADAKKFEAGLIAMKLKESSPASSFRRILIYSTNSQSRLPEYADLNKVLPIIDKFSKIKADLIPTNMKTQFENDSILTPSSYMQDSLEAYKAFINMHANARDGRKINDEMITNFQKDKNGYEQMMYTALQEAKSIEAAGLASEPVFNYEMYLLRNIYYNLEKIGNEIYPIGFKGQFISMPQNVPSDVIQDLAAKTSDTLRSVTERFWEKYKKPTEGVFKSLFSRVTSPGFLRDVTLSDTDRYYEPLLERKSLSTISGTDRDGNAIVEKKDLYTYNLLDEHSDAFKQLDERQKDFIKMFNERVAEAMEELGIKWTKGRMPLVPASYRNQLYKAYSLGIDSTVDHYRNSLRKMFDAAESSFVETVKPDNEFSVRNSFTAQANDEFTDGRDNMIGLSKDGFVDMDKHGQWETNLEIVLDLVMMTAYRTSQMNRLNNIFLAAKNHFDWQKSNLFEDRLGANIDFVKTYRTAIIENKDVDAGTIQNKAVRSANKIASAVLLGFKPGVALLSTVGQQFTAASQAVSNSLANTGRYTAGNWTKAFGVVMNPVNWKKVNALLEQYKLYQLDMTSLLNGYHRYGDKSIFKMKWMYGFLNAGDWLSRSQILVAQMIQDGSWDAYSMQDGELVYDEDKDGRFEGENGKLLKEVIYANLDKEGHVINNKMTRAYDSNINRSIKAQIDMVIGGFDRETRGMYNFRSLGRLLGLFKTYMPSRIDKLTSAPFQSRMIGKYELTEEDGKKSYLWKGDQLEGIFHSLNVGMYYLKNLNSENNVKLSDEQRQNIARFGGDLLFMGLASLMAFALDDNDEKTKMDDFTAYALQGAVRDLLAFYNVLGYLEFVSTPVAIGFLQKTAKRVYNIAMNASDPNSETLIDSIELLPAAKEYGEIVDYLSDQPAIE